MSEARGREFTVETLPAPQQPQRRDCQVWPFAVILRGGWTTPSCVCHLASLMSDRFKQAYLRVVRDLLFEIPMGAAVRETREAFKSQ